MADHGHYGRIPQSTRQGTYICTPNGKFLASGNSLNPDQMLQMMQEGLAAWNALPEADRVAGSDGYQPHHRWEDSYPEDGLVLHMTVRNVLESAIDHEDLHGSWNHDNVWFSRKEARRWLPKDTDPSVKNDSTYRLPLALTERLVRFHLRDVVRGQTTAFRRSEIDRATIEISTAQQSPFVFDLTIHGSTKTHTKRSSEHETPHGVATKILGSARYRFDDEQHRSGRFETFELVAVGMRWGRTRFNSREEELDPSPIGFVFRMATEDTPKVAPARISDYHADWVVQPDPNRSHE